MGLFDQATGPSRVDRGGTVREDLDSGTVRQILAEAFGSDRLDIGQPVRFRPGSNFGRVWGRTYASGVVVDALDNGALCVHLDRPTRYGPVAWAMPHELEAVRGCDGRDDR